MNACRLGTLASVALALGAIACGGSPAVKSETEEVIVDLDAGDADSVDDTEDAGVRELDAGEVAVDGGVAVSDAGEPEGAVEAQVFDLAEGESASTGHGIGVAYLRRSHKHQAKGGATGIWEVEIDRGGEKRVVEVRGRRPFAEVDAFGLLFVISESSGDRIRVELRPGGVKQVERSEAGDVLLAELKRVGVMLDGTQRSSSVSDGILHSEVKQGKKVFARAGLGLFTRELRYLERPFAAQFKPDLPKPLEKLRVGHGARRTSDGISVRIADEGHGDAIDGAVAIVDFAISKGGKTLSVQLVGQVIYGEARAFDRVFVFKEDAEGRVFARVYPARGSIGMDRAIEIADSLVKKLGLDPDRSSLGDGPTGAYEFTYRAGDRVLCTGLIGAYTGRVVQFELVDTFPIDRAESPFR